MCGTCGVEKSLSEFYFRNGKPRSYCKQCSKKSSKAYHSKNREKILEKKKDYYEEHKNEILEKMRIHYQENSDKKKEYQREYNIKNAEKLRTKKKERYIKNREAILSANRHYRNTEHGRQIRSLCHHRRRARLKQAEGSFSLPEWREALAFFESKCAYCGSSDAIQKDHFIPLSKNGNHSADNIVPACQRCNSSKQDSNPEEWYERQEFYSYDNLEKIKQFLKKNTLTPR
ncbi:HNH endonuclease [Psychrobacillus sp. MER TA 17]|nr:HNH endonuclease [Psychrobacillus sp. MER TA 17]